MLVQPAMSQQLRKPLLVIAITDGQPAGEDRNTLSKVITNAAHQLSRTPYTADAVSYQFSQVGNDKGGQYCQTSILESPS